MAYTQADLTKIESAIVALAAGERTVRVTTAGGKSIEYGQADLPQLRALRDSVKKELETTSTTTRYIRTSTGKGL